MHCACPPCTDPLTRWPPHSRQAHLTFDRHGGTTNDEAASAKKADQTAEVNGIDFHVSQQVMCSASDDMKVIIWDFQEGITLRTLDKHTKAVYGCIFLGQENQFLLATC